MENFPDIVLAYGQSDEYSFLFRRETCVYNRRESKLTSLLASQFTSNYVFHWNAYFDSSLLYPPSFDARAVCYPTDSNIKDYFRWRQVDCHINNLYNMCFWNLVQSGKTETEAEQILAQTNSAGKNELLFSEFATNYNNVDEIYRKGTILYRKKKSIKEFHGDIIQETFWNEINI